MTKKISPVQKREQEFENIIGISHDKVLTGVLMGAISVEIEPEFMAWCEVREERRKHNKPWLNKWQAKKMARRKLGSGVLCSQPSGKEYIFVVSDGDTELGRGPSWEAAIDAAVKAKRGEQ